VSAGGSGTFDEVVVDCNNYLRKTEREVELLLVLVSMKKGRTEVS
jgi:hypothetical protein